MAFIINYESKTYKKSLFSEKLDFAEKTKIGEIVSVLETYTGGDDLFLMINKYLGYEIKKIKQDNSFLFQIDIGKKNRLYISQPNSKENKITLEGIGHTTENGSIDYIK